MFIYSANARFRAVLPAGGVIIQFLVPTTDLSYVMYYMKKYVDPCHGMSSFGKTNYNPISPPQTNKTSKFIMSLLASSSQIADWHATYFFGRYIFLAYIFTERVSGVSNDLQEIRERK